MGNRNSIATLALGASFFALCVIALGAFTRLIDAGLGCPDWPGCYGHLVVPVVSPGLVKYKAWAEMIHRYFAGSLGLFMVCLSVVVFAKRAYRTRENILLVVCLLLLLMYQIMLGQWTVTLKLLPIIVTQHLLGGFLILSTLWLIVLSNSESQSMSLFQNKKMSVWWSVLALILVFMQITLGAWTSTNNASLSCPDFPMCMSNPILDIAALPLQAIQMAHRYGALIVTLYMLLLTLIMTWKYKPTIELMKSIIVIWGLLCTQLCLGISNVIFKLPLITAICHTLVAALLLLAVITFLYKQVKS